MNKLTLMLAAATLALCKTAAAQMVAIEWDAAGQFSKALAVAPGKFVEACEKLPKGAQVSWSFEAASPLAFNIHYHEGKQVRFPDKKSQVAKAAGVLRTPREQDYCWMWTNKGSTEAMLSFSLGKR